MKRSILIAFSAMVLAGGIFVAGKAVATNRNDIISSNAEALSASESAVGAGGLCAYQPNWVCVWHFSDENIKVINSTKV